MLDLVPFSTSMEHMGMSTNGIKMSINNATKNSLKRRVYVCQPWPGPLRSDPRYVDRFRLSFSFFLCLGFVLQLSLVTSRHFGHCHWLRDNRQRTAGLRWHTTP